jgi:hypothetical protein
MAHLRPFANPDRKSNSRPSSFKAVSRTPLDPPQAPIEAQVRFILDGIGPCNQNSILIDCDEPDVMEK